MAYSFVMKNCFLMLSRLKIHIRLALDRLRCGGSTGNLSSMHNTGYVSSVSNKPIIGL